MPKPRPRVYIDVVQNLQEGGDFNLVFHVGALLLSSQLPLHTNIHTHIHPGLAGFQSSRHLMREEAFLKIKFSICQVLKVLDSNCIEL